MLIALTALVTLRTKLAPIWMILVGALLGAIAMLFTHEQRRGRAKAGLLLNVVVIVVGVIRLSLGGGII